MSVIQTAGFAIPQDEASRKRIKSALSDISDYMTKIESYRTMIKDIVSSVSDDHQIPKKYVAKMAKIYHAQSFAQVSAENEQLEILYETVNL